MALIEDPAPSGLLITETEAEIVTEGATYTRTVQVWLNLDREPRLLLQFATDQKLSFLSAAQSLVVPKFQVKFSGAKRSCACVAHADRTGLHGTLIQLIPESAVWFGEKDEALRIRVLLANFGNYHFANGPLIFGDRFFTWSLAPLSDEEREPFEPHESREIHITHSAILVRTDGNLISVGEMEEEVEKFRLFLSFCQGGWVGPLCLEGLDADGATTFESWRSPMISSYRQTSRGWLDAFEGHALADAWPGFVAKSKDPLWNETLKLSFYWLLRGDIEQVGPDGGLILLQAAFERLAWHVLVIDKPKPAFRDGDNAAKKLRLLLSDRGIPSDLPATLPKLADVSKWQKLIKGNEPIDGPAAITTVRNNLVHPKAPLADKKLPYAEAYFLARHYLQLCLLSLFKFNGNHIDWTNLPRWAGEVRRVPWARRD